MKKITLKTIKLLLIASAATAALSAGVFADEICSDIGITSADEKIIVNTAEDCIEIEQLPYNHSGYSMNTDVISGKLSADGYELSYADTDKNETSLEYFTDGYVKAVRTEEPEDVKYIPIKMRKSSETDIDLTKFYFNPKGGSKQSSRTGIAGKPEDDSAYIIIPPDGGSTDVEGVSVDSKFDGAGNTISWTCEMNIYADGNTTLFVNGRYLSDASRNVFKWYPNGDVEINDGGTMRKAATAERAQWHKLALSYSSVRHRVLVFLDGKLISVTTAPFWTDISTFVYGSCAGSSDGICAFDDGKAYIGYYYENYYNRKELASKNVSTVVEENVIWTDLSVNKNFDALIGTLDNADDIGICGEYGENAKLVAVKGTDYTYYTVKNGLFADVEIVRTSTDLSVRATVIDKLNSQKSGVMILSLINGDGSVNKIVATDTLDITESGTVFNIEPFETEITEAEVIFISDWTDRNPLVNKVFKEAEQ